jgi:hypothetical protein
VGEAIEPRPARPLKHCPKTRPGSGLSNPPARGRIDLRLLSRPVPAVMSGSTSCGNGANGNAVRRRHLAVTYRGLRDMPRSGLLVCGHVSQYAL